LGEVITAISAAGILYIKAEQQLGVGTLVKEQGGIVVGAKDMGAYPIGINTSLILLGIF
jgi:hypothetical protein